VEKTKGGMQIVVLGASGFVGQHLIKSLLDRYPSARIVAVSRKISKLAFAPSVRVIQAGLGANPDLMTACRDASAIIHLAWSTTPSISNVAPLNDVMDNLVGSVAFLEAISRDFRKRLIFMSSGGTVYGQPINVPIPETHPIRPITSYGIAKFGVEEYVELYGTKHGFDYTILRAANLYGPGQLQKNGQGVIPAILNSLKNDDPFVMWGDGSAIRDYVYVSDVVDAILKAVERPQAIGNRFNIGSGDGNSLLEVLEAIEEITQRRVQINQRPTRSSDVPVNVLDISKARKLLDWQPRVGLKDGLRRTIEHELCLA